MASHSYLRRLARIERDNALAILDQLLPEDDGDRRREREALWAAQHDVVGKNEWEFVVNSLVGSLARVVAAQQEEIDELKKTKATTAALTAVKKESKK